MTTMTIAGKIEEKVEKDFIKRLKSEEILSSTKVKNGNTIVYLKSDFLPDGEVNALYTNPVIFFEINDVGLERWVNKRNIKYLSDNNIRYVSHSIMKLLININNYFSDNLMLLDDYQKKAQKTMPKSMIKEDADKYGCMKLAEEIGELTGMVAKHYYHDQQFNRENLQEELGDLLWYIALLAKNNNFSLSSVAKYNVEKLRKRHGEEYDPSYYKEIKD